MRRLGLLFLLAIAAAGGSAAWLDHETNRLYRGYSAPQVFVDIPHGTSRWGVATLLQKSGVIHSRVAFVILSRWHSHQRPQAGEYLFDHAMRTREVFAKLAAGQIFVHEVTVPEGWTMFEIADELERQSICTRKDFLEAARNPSAIRDLAPEAMSLEGFLFPSTYAFTRHATPEQIAEKMVAQFRAVLPELRQPSDPSALDNYSLEQVVTMASLVERETPQPDERPLVAGVFYNRLKLGVRLQCDPTVQYALELKNQPARTVRPEDLRMASPYNTYRHAGLPPGPIANPGEKALHAALHPAKTDYLYFVANDQGGHFFSRTLAEHDHNVARYRHLLAGDAAPVPAPPPRGQGNGKKHRRPS